MTVAVPILLGVAAFVFGFGVLMGASEIAVDPNDTPIAGLMLILLAAVLVVIAAAVA